MDIYKNSELKFVMFFYHRTTFVMLRNNFLEIYTVKLFFFHYTRNKQLKSFGGVKRYPGSVLEG